MVTQSLLALRYPKQEMVHYHVLTSAAGLSIEVINGVDVIKAPQQHAIACAPRKFTEVAKVRFWVAMRNTHATDEIVNARLVVWTASAGDDPADPDVATIVPGAMIDGSTVFTGAAINNKLFNRSGTPVTLSANQSLGGAILELEFDVFTAADAEFFQAWNKPQTPDEFISFNFGIAQDSGDVVFTQVFSFGFTVTQAPNPINNTTTYQQFWFPRSELGSGQQVFDADNPTVHDQIRGAWRFRYRASEWDGITGIHLFVLWSVGSGAGGIDFRFNELTSEVIDGASTTPLVDTNETPPLGDQSYGWFRSVNLLPLMVDGRDYTFDYRHTTGNVAAGGFGGEPFALLEIVQQDCTKTVSFFSPSCSATRAATGIQVGDPLGFAANTVIDPLFFQRYPDSLFTRRMAFAQIVHPAPGIFDPLAQVMMNSDLTEDQLNDGTPCTTCALTPTTTEVQQMSATPINTARWTFQELTMASDPINFAGVRRLFYRQSAFGTGSNGDHPGVIGLLYAYAVPNTEFLDLGPLFPVGEFNPEGCAATSAGLGDPGILVITNGSTLPQKFDPVANKIEDNGVPVPFEGEFPQGSALTVNNASFSPDGGIVPGRYEYRYTFRNCCTGKESDPNPDTFIIDSAAAGAGPAAQHSISFVGIRIPSDPQICEICLYRTAAGGSFPIMAKVGCFDVNLMPPVFVDNVPDSQLNFIAEGLSLLNAPMPCVPVVIEYQNRLFGLGDIAQLAPAGTVSVVLGSKFVTGDDAVDWDRCLEGKFFQAVGDCRAYEIERILPPVVGTSPAIGQLKLVEEYEGATDTGLSYTICGHQNRLFFSEPLEPECWPNINFLDVEPGDGDKLIGGASNFGSLVICKRRKTYLLRFRENPLLEVNVPQRISTDIGCIGPRSFAQVENGTVWLSDRGLALFDGRGVMHIPASDRFNDMLINPDNPNYVRRDGQGRVIDAVGVFYPKREQYLLLLPTVKTLRGSNVMLVWDTSLDNITLYEFCQEFQSMVVAKDSDGNQRVYLGDTNGFVWMFDVGNTDGVGFPNATGTVEGTVTAAGLDNGASFLDDATASFVTGGLPQLALLSGVQGLTPAFSTLSPDASSELGSAGVCLFTRAKDAALDAPWVERTVYATTETRIYVTPGWGSETPDPEDDYMLGAIEFEARFKPKDYGTDDSQKRDWKQVVTYIPEAVSTSLRVELRLDFASIDDEELTIVGENGETGEGRTFDLSFARGRLTRPVGRRVYNYMQVVLKNFAPDEPVRLLNHTLLSNPRTQ